jgi:hypothetical protein
MKEKKEIMFLKHFKKCLNKILFHLFILRKLLLTEN